MECDQRPIHPDKQYVEKAEAKYKESQIKGRQYLKKNDDQKLPCFRSNRPRGKREKKNKIKSKAEIYEQIKKRNRQKFGDRVNKNNPLKVQKQKKINPKNMTVNYKHKKVQIDTQQYKKPGYIPKSPQVPSDKQKLEYERMIEYLKHQSEQLERQKVQFKKVEEKLKFKQVISKCEPIQIQISAKVRCKTERKAIHQSQFTNLENQEPNEPHSSEKKDSQNQLSPNPQYPIQSISEHNPFTLREIFKYASIQQFHHENHPLYQEASKILQNQRNSAIIEQINGKRISKFSNGWYETWMGGKYRTAFSQNDHYKVTWYSNGDVRQQFRGGKVITYFSKKNRVNEVNTMGKDKILFFSEIGQIEMHSKERKEIRFPDGHFEVVDY